MKPPYRVQEYVFDMGAYHKHQIIDGVSHGEYCERNVFHNGFYVILSSNDIFGNHFPQTVKGECERVDMTRKHEVRNEM